MTDEKIYQRATVIRDSMIVMAEALGIRVPMSQRHLVMDLFEDIAKKFNLTSQDESKYNIRQIIQFLQVPSTPIVLIDDLVGGVGMIMVNGFDTPDEAVAWGEKFQETEYDIPLWNMLNLVGTELSVTYANPKMVYAGTPPNIYARRIYRNSRTGFAGVNLIGPFPSAAYMEGYMARDASARHSDEWQGITIKGISEHAGRQYADICSIHHADIDKLWESGNTLFTEQAVLKTDVIAGLPRVTLELR